MAQYDVIFKNATVINQDDESVADIAADDVCIAALGVIEGHSGMTGEQTLVPTMPDHVNAGRLSHQRSVVANKGRIASGGGRDPQPLR